MLTNSLLRAAGALVCALALAAPVGAAHAETQRHRDPRGDVVALEPGKNPRAAVDILRSANAYQKRALRLHVETVEAPPARGFELQWHIRTPAETFRLIYRRDGGRFPYFALLEGDSEAEIECTMTLSTAESGPGSYSARVARSCLGTPDRVRISALIGRGSNVLVDDARRTGFTDGHPATLGPWLSYR